MGGFLLEIGSNATARNVIRRSQSLLVCNCITFHFILDSQLNFNDNPTSA